MIIPKILSKEQAIGIYSPSGSVTYSESDTALYEKGLMLRSRGYRIKEGRQYVTVFIIWRQQLSKG